MPTHTIAERRKRGFPAKAKKILSHGSVAGRGLISSAGTPNRSQARRLKRRRAIVRTPT